MKCSGSFGPPRGSNKGSTFPSQLSAAGPGARHPRPAVSGQARGPPLSKTLVPDPPLCGRHPKLQETTDTKVARGRERAEGTQGKVSALPYGHPAPGDRTGPGCVTSPQGRGVHANLRALQCRLGTLCVVCVHLHVVRDQLRPKTGHRHPFRVHRGTKHVPCGVPLALISLPMLQKLLSPPTGTPYP